MQTDQNRAVEIAALRRELAGYEQRGLDARADAVRAQLARLGDEQTPAPRGTTRTRTNPTRQAR